MAPGKKGKKKELSEEQKQRVADQKALAEKERLVRRHQLTTAFLKLKKEKEYRLITLNDNKLLDLWRPRLRKLKIQELIADFEGKRLSFEVAYEKKNQLIEELENVIHLNNREYDNTVDAHLHNMDKMLNFYHIRLKELNEKHEGSRNAVLSIHNQEKLHLQNEQSQNLQYLNEVKESVALRHKEITIECKNEFENREEQIRNKFMQSSLELKEEVESKTKFIWLHINKIIASYNRSIAPLRKEFLQLSKKDHAISMEMDGDSKRICTLQKGIKKLDTQLRLFAKVYDNLMQSLQSKKKEYQKSYSKQSLNERIERKKNANSIRCLALASHNVLETLDGLIIQRERTRRSIDRSLKLEKHKIDSLLRESALEDLLKQDKTIVDIKSSEILNLDIEDYEVTAAPTSVCCDCKSSVCTCKNIAPKPYLCTMIENSLMDKFWTRFNRVNLDRAAYALRKENLKRDNYQLKIVMKNYMSDMNPKCHAKDLFQLNQFGVMPTFLVSPVAGSPINDNRTLENFIASDDDIEALNSSLYALPPISHSKSAHANNKDVQSTLMSRMDDAKTRRIKSNYLFTDQLKRSSQLVGMNIIEGAHVVQRWVKFHSFSPNIGVSTAVSKDVVRQPIPSSNAT